MSLSLTLDDTEREILLDILINRLGELREQVTKAELAAFRDELSHEESTLRRLIDKVQGFVSGEAHSAEGGEHRIERGPIEKLA
jgi:hypothetical protein